VENFPPLWNHAKLLLCYTRRAVAGNAQPGSEGKPHGRHYLVQIDVLGFDAEGVIPESVAPFCLGIAKPGEAIVDIHTAPVGDVVSHTGANIPGKIRRTPGTGSGRTSICLVPARSVPVPNIPFVAPTTLGVNESQAETAANIGREGRPVPEVIIGVDKKGLDPQFLLYGIAVLLRQAKLRSCLPLPVQHGQHSFRPLQNCPKAEKKCLCTFWKKI